MKVLAIVGSMNLEGNAEAQRIIDAELDTVKPDRVVSGGAHGIDSMAQRAAEARGIEVVVHLPKTRRWVDGFMPRNQLIANDCTELVRIVPVDHGTYGSGWTRDRAAEMGKPTREYRVKSR